MPTTPPSPPVTDFNWTINTELKPGDISAGTGSNDSLVLNNTGTVVENNTAPKPPPPLTPVPPTPAPSNSTN
jgi:hypothetical protein